ncbi:CARDB domain-containing protein [Planctomycetota bacterium]
MKCIAFPLTSVLVATAIICPAWTALAQNEPLPEPQVAAERAKSDVKRSTTPVKPKIRPVKPTPTIINLPDFSVADIICVQERQGGSYYPNKIVRRLKATLKNNGKAYDGPLDFKLVAREEPKTSYSFDKIIPKSKVSVPQGGQTEVGLYQHPGFKWPEPWNEHPTLSFTLYVDPENKIRERNEKNNTFAEVIRWPHIKVQYPNGGEILEPGKSCTIRWTSWQVAGNVKIFAEQHTILGTSLNKGRSICENAPNSGRFTWKIPNGEEKWPAGYYRVRVSSMDDRTIFDHSDNIAVLVGYAPPNWYTPEVRINPQEIEVAVTKAIRIKPKNRFKRMSPNVQTNFELPWEQDLDVEFQIPFEYLGLEQKYPVSAAITFGADNPTVTTMWIKQFSGLFDTKQRFFVRQGATTNKIKFQLKAQALQMLQAKTKPIAIEIVIESPSAKWKSTFTTFMRLLPPSASQK